MIDIWWNMNIKTWESEWGNDYEEEINGSLNETATWTTITTNQFTWLLLLLSAAQEFKKRENKKARKRIRRKKLLKISSDGRTMFFKRRKKAPREGDKNNKIGKKERYMYGGNGWRTKKEVEQHERERARIKI